MPALTEVDKQLFRSLRVADDVLLRSGTDRAEDGIRFPYFPLLSNGNGCGPLTYRIRLDKPTGDGKYRSEPGRHHLYFAPVKPEWIKDKSTPVVFVEAEKSALMLLSFTEAHSIPLIPIATGGCWGFRGTVGKTEDAHGKRVDEKGPLPALEVVQQRDCYLWADKNVDTSPAVHSAQKHFLETLKQFFPKSRRVVKWPEDTPPQVNGPDDFVCLQGYLPIIKILFAAEPVTDITAAQATAVDIPDLPKECLDGELGNVCTSCLGEFPRAYAWPALLAYASALIQRDPGDRRTNIYSALVGPVHSGKSQTELWTRNVLAVPESNLISTYVGSGEQLAPLLDVAGNARLFAPGELAHTMRKMQIERASLPHYITRLFDEDALSMTQSRQGNKQPAPVNINCHFSLVGGIVLDEFEELFSAATTRFVHRARRASVQVSGQRSGNGATKTTSHTTAWLSWPLELP